MALHTTSKRQVWSIGISSLLVLFTVASLLVVSGFNPTSFKSPFSYSASAADPTAEEFFIFDGAGTITDYDAENGPSDVVIPSTIGGIPVTAIGDSAFSSYGLTSVIIPDSVTDIGIAAFQQNNIVSVDLGEGVTTIEIAAFYGNQITSVTLPNSLVTIGSSVFMNNELTAISFPDSITSIGISAFKSNQISTVVIPDSVTSISTGMFDGNPVTSVTIGTADFSGTPTTVIQGGAFSGGIVESVTIGNSVLTIESAFTNNPITSLDLGESVQTIGGGAFYNTLLTNIVIPNSVTQIQGGAFAGGPSVLKSLTIGTADFVGTPTLALTPSVFNVGELESVVLGNNVLSINTGTFCGSKISSLDLGESIKTINPSGFCSTQLTSVTIPDSVTTLGQSAFGGSPLLTSATIGSLDFTGMPGMTIQSHVFMGAPLETLIIGNSVTTIESAAFYGLHISSLTLGETVQTIGTAAFDGNRITSLVIPASLTSLSNAFYNNYITTITINGDTTIAPSTFSNNTTNTGSYITFYTEDPSNPYGYTDVEETYIVNPAQVSVRYVDEDGNELSPAVTTVGEGLADYSVANNPTADFSLYYRGGDTFLATATAIDGYLTPANQTVALVPGSNIITMVYALPVPDPVVPVGPIVPTPAVPNTGMTPLSMSSLVGGASIIVAVFLSIGAALLVTRSVVRKMV